MGTIESTCGNHAFHSHMKEAVTPALCDVGAAVLDPGKCEGQGGPKDSTLDNCAYEAALKEHHVALHRFICEWMERQEQLLLRKGQATSETLTGVEGDSHCPSKEGAQTEHLHFPPFPQGQLGQLMSNNEIFEVPVRPDDIAGQPQHEECDRGTPKEPTSELMQADVHAVFDSADDMSTESQQNRRNGDRANVREKLSTPRYRNSSVYSLKLQMSESASMYVDAASECVVRVSNVVNNRFDCPLINRIEASRSFSFFCGLVIFLNAMNMAFAADYEMKNFRVPANERFLQVEMMFVFIYTMELVIRIIARRVIFFMSAWSWFDVAIVCTGWFEIISSSSTSLTQVRLMRILKMMKVMRVLRVMRSLREVRLLLNSLMGSVKPLFWTVIVITGTNFMFGICFVQSIAAFRHEDWKNGDNGDGQSQSEQLEILFSTWDSVPQAMYTLFKVSTGGVNWGEVSDPLLLIMGMPTFSIFLVYIAFFAFVMTNAVTAIFVSSTEEYARLDSHAMLYDQLHAKTEYMKQVIPLYQEMDSDQNGEVSKTEFEKYILDPRMVAFAHSLDINTMDLEQFFDVLSCRGERPVNLDTFVDGCIRLRGTARSMDVYDLLIHHHSLKDDVGRIRSLLERQALRVSA